MFDDKRQKNSGGWTYGEARSLIIERLEREKLIV